MSGRVNESIQSMLSKMESFISSKTVVGEPAVFDGVTLVPLVEVSFCVGSGLSEKQIDKQAGGGALGAKISPAAVIVINNGTVQLVNVKNQESVNKLIDMIPGVLAKFNLDSFFTKKETGEPT
jgi:uncharacterized spore protein YtfJ